LALLAGRRRRRLTGPILIALARIGLIRALTRLTGIGLSGTLLPGVRRILIRHLIFVRHHWLLL